MVYLKKKAEQLLSSPEQSSDGGAITLHQSIKKPFWLGTRGKNILWRKNITRKKNSTSPPPFSLTQIMHVYIAQVFILL